MGRRNNYNAAPHIFLSRTDLHRRYYELLKEARTWSGMAQYELAKQTNLLAQRLLNGEEVSNVIIKSETYFMDTKKKH
jgi:ribosome-binding protein aMBF1 (putative translation factor)